jgi:signal transduction histidine kinase
LRPWLHVTPGVEAFEWVPYVPQDGLAAFEAASRDAEFPDYHVNPHGPDTPAGAPPPPFHAPILYVEPMQEERDAVGYDLATSPERLRALEEARDTGAVVSTRGIRLVLHPDEWGMLVLAAAYGGVEPPASLAERRKAIRGFVATVIRIDGLVADALAQAGHPEMVVRVSELSEAGERLLSGPAEPPEAGPDAPRWTSVYTVGGQTLRLEFLPSLVIAQSWAGWMVLAGALAATGLLVSIVLDTRAQAVRVERIVQARTAELAQSNEALARSSLELQRVAYVASHDLREPLRTITAFGEMLERDAAHLDPCARDHLRRITRAARRMQALVSELLAFVRVERGVERFVAVPMGEPVHVALDDLSALVEHSGAEVHVGRLPYALCDRVQMVLLFTNLFSNALKFRRPGVVPQIVVDGGVSGADCEIRVRDNGLGIPARDRERIFELFQRLHADDAYPGRGIGLAMCRRIVERHGGRIWVESEPGVGSVFHVVLPAAGAS